MPILMTYVIVGLFPFKISLARKSFPVPAENPEEHYRWIEAKRRLSLHNMDALRWLFLLILASWTWSPGWGMPGGSAWLLGLRSGLALAICVYIGYVLLREQRRVVSMGRDLRPQYHTLTPASRAPRRLCGPPPLS